MFVIVASLGCGRLVRQKDLWRVNYRRRDLCFSDPSFGMAMTTFTESFRLDGLRQTGISQPDASCVALGGKAYAENGQHRVGRPPFGALHGAGTEAGGRTP